MAVKTILVTGSNGLLGQKLVYKLRNREDIKLIATARGDNRLIATDGYVYTSMDITNKANVDEVIDQYQPDCVIHTAAMTNVDQSELNKEDCKKANVDAVEYIVEACERNKAHLVHVSTDFIFDGENGPYNEEDEPNPVSYYGWSKLEGEKIVEASKLDWAIIRAILVFGVVDNMSRSNFALWAKRELENGKPIKVVDDQFRTPTLAEDLADLCISAALKKATGVYHSGSDKLYSILELVEIVADFYNLDKSLISAVSSETLNQPAKRPPKTGFIIDKAKRDLDYKPLSYEEALKVLDEQLKVSAKAS